MFWKLAAAVLKKRLRRSPTVQASVEEAASNHLGKASKVETAMDSVFVEDLRELARADRERVAAYAASRVPGLSAGQTQGRKQVPGDFIVCDDYRKGTGTVPVVVLGLVAIASAGLAAWAALRNADPPQPGPPPPDTATQYEARLRVD